MDNESAGQGGPAIPDTLNTLINQEVEVVASGVTYRGVLKEVSEEEVQLLAETGWLTVSMDQVNVIRRAPRAGPDQPLAGARGEALHREGEAGSDGPGESPGPDTTKDVPLGSYKNEEEDEKPS